MKIVKLGSWRQETRTQGLKVLEDPTAFIIAVHSFGIAKGKVYQVIPVVLRKLAKRLKGFDQV